MLDSFIYLELAKIITYTALSFLLAIWWAPYLIRLLRWLKFWKKSARKTDSNGQEYVVMKKFYEENEKKRLVPRAGGLLIWITTLAFAVFFWILLKIEPTSKIFQFLNFVDRSETFIPIGTLFFSSILGFVDDALVTLETGGNYHGGGLKLTHRAIFVAFMSFLIGLWFHFRLDFLHTIKVPFLQSNGQWLDFDLTKISPAIDLSNTFLNLTIPAGWIIIPITIFIVVGLWGGTIIDGFDGLAAGVFIPMYLAFAALAFNQGAYDIATFLMVMTGTMCAYLWFNLPPAKFYMGDTGSTGILITLAVVAIILDKVYLLPIVGFLLYLTVASDIIQIFSKKFFKRKVFLAAPIHHHFEAKGIPRHVVTMSYWAISCVCSAVALVIGLIIR